MPHIPLIEDLTTGPIPAGSNILVEFDPTSQWYNASFTLGVGWLKTGGSVAYNTFAQPPENVRNRFRQLGLDDAELENAEQLRIIDWYTSSLGQKSKEKIAVPSLKVADLSIDFMKNQLTGPPIPDRIRITDNGSVHARFNEEKPWMEFLLTRGLQIAQTRKSTAITGLMTGVHSEWVYRQMEGAHDVVVDFKLEEASNGETIDVMRIRNARNVTFTKGWHRLRIGQNFEVTLEK
jgi:KaiC/GvpD/RAD55 family RecA-like ATPase